MPSPESLQEADRQLTICNACRYCEGYCAVFPTMTTRREFSTEDLIYMANLCFECRACYYACQYAPPHDFKINIPQALSELRTETYRDFTWGSLLSRLFHGNQTLVALTVGVMVALIFGSILAVQGSEVLFEANTSEGAFFDVIPYYAMVVPALLLSFYAIGALAIGGVRFWRNSGASLGDMVDLASFKKASQDAFGLEYLKGGNAGGCNYPTERFSNARRYAHHLMVWGVLGTFASTTVAAIYHNILGRESPYPYLSLPVVLGTVGGIATIIGVAWLLALKSRADPAPSFGRMLALDNAFLLLLGLTNVSGLGLMLLRETSIMGTLLAVHLGIVAALYLTLPYGKFAHVIYRYAALIRYRLEQRRGAAKAAATA